MKTVYRFTKEGFFAGEKILDEFTDKNPETGEWILPENTTDVPMELPYKEGGAPYWNGKKWVYSDDSEGLLPKEEDREETQKLEGSSENLDFLKTKKIQELKSIRDVKEIEPIEVDGSLYDFDDRSRDRLMIARRALEDAGVPDATITWTTADNQRVKATIATFAAINGAAAKRSNKLHIRYNELKNLVLGCATIYEINAIEWD